MSLLLLTRFEYTAQCREDEAVSSFYAHFWRKSVRGSAEYCRVDFGVCEGIEIFVYFGDWSPSPNPRLDPKHKTAAKKQRYTYRSFSQNTECPSSQITFRASRKKKARSLNEMLLPVHSPLRTLGHHLVDNVVLLLSSSVIPTRVANKTRLTRLRSPKPFPPITTLA